MTHVLDMGFTRNLNRGDLAPQAAVECSGDFIANAIKTSLFTNRRDAGLQAGGCWSDMLYEDSFGSLLWTKQREKLTGKLLIELDQICRDALRWMVVEGHIKAIDVAVEESGPRAITITVTAHLNNDQTQTRTEEYVLQEVN
ncbi:MAG: hypothetical protein C9356_12525 [Oleiphilus sp.]|nr:MAG: hypothetical protein C9356_12525 [Oleiphilus sp.]